MPSVTERACSNSVTLSLQVETCRLAWSESPTMTSADAAPTAALPHRLATDGMDQASATKMPISGTYV